jgi:hypothetical protein
MAWKTRGRHGRRYLYAYQNGRTQYVGAEGSPAAIQAAEETAAKNALRQERQRLDALATLANTTLKTIELLVASQMLTSGFYFRKSEWRKEQTI